MNKRQRIRELYENGEKSPKRIAELTGYSYQYVANTLGDIRNPGAMLAALKRWRIANPDKRKRSKQQHLKNVRGHQDATRPHATNHRQKWTVHEIEHLATHGKTKTIRQLALELGRSYCSIIAASHKFGIDLGYREKTGLNAQRFKTPTTA